MPIHIGKMIQAEAWHLGLTYKQFGALIYKSEKTVPLIYKRATPSIDLLITISVALKKDYVKVIYEDERMRSLRSDEIAKLQQQVKALTERVEQLTMENQELIDARREVFVMQGYT
jgi:hypothetical protein